MNNYVIVDLQKQEIIKEYFANNDDDAIAYIFTLYNPRQRITTCIILIKPV
jgi:hypothetical protein